MAIAGRLSTIEFSEDGNTFVKEHTFKMINVIKTLHPSLFSYQFVNPHD